MMTSELIIMKALLKYRGVLFALGMLIPAYSYSQQPNYDEMEAIRKQNIEIVQQMYDAMSKKDLERWLSFWHEDGIQFIPYSPEGFPKSVNGKDALREVYTNLLSGYGNLNFTHIEIEPLADPNRVMVRWGVDIELTGQASNYQNELIGTFEFKDGKVIQFYEYFNPLEFNKISGDD